MTSSASSSPQLAFLYWTEKAISNPIKWAILISGSALLSYWNWQGIPLEGMAAILCYGVQNLAFTLLFARASFSLPTAKVLILLSYTFDFLFVAYLIFGLRGTASQIAFLMYGTLVFKAGLYYPAFRGSLAILPLAVGFYLAMVGLREGVQVLDDYAFRPRLFLLLGFPVITAYTARLADHRERRLWDLNTRLEGKTNELKRQTRELEAVIQGMRDGLLVVDPTLNVVTLNPGARSILRLAQEVQLPVPLAVNENGLALREVVAEALAAKDKTGQSEVRLPLPNEGESDCRTYDAVASCLANDGCPDARVVVILRDITEQRRLEEAKSNFLSVVSHELRTPLSSIKGFMNIILSGRAGPLNDRQKDFLSTAQGQAEYLHAMIDDVVESSRIQVQRAALDLSLVSLAEITRSVAARLMPLVQDKGLQLANLVPDEFPLIEGDRLRLDQVVTNLVCNAIKFTPEGGTITLSAREEGEKVVYCVEDTGMGIPADQQEKIFEQFYQVSTGSARLHGGMGLGLAICKHVVQRHNGRLLVESVVGQGSIFRFVLAKRFSPLGQRSREPALIT